MINITPYKEYNVSEALSSVSSFLKAQYNNIFQNPNQTLSNLFNDFTKKVDIEKNVSNLYQKYLRTNQTAVQNEINKTDSIDNVNKLLTDEIKYFYFSLKPIVNKLQNDEFTIQSIFERSKDKRLQTLMSYPEDQFSNAVQQYVNDGVLPWVKKDAGLDEPKEQQQTQQPPQQNAPQSATEKIRYDLSKILEADEPNAEQTADKTANDLISYKKSAIKWVNLSLFELLKPKMTLLTQLGANTGNTIDELSKQMKGTQNENAKKMILNKIFNMNKEELQNLANSIGIGKEELGQL